MIGAIAGDIIGSVYEWDNIKTKNFQLFAEKSRFTDDSVMTAAVAEAVINYNSSRDLEKFETETVLAMQRLGRKYINAGYGGRFFGWLLSDAPKPYNSFGNGSAMRVSPVAYTAKTLEEAETLAEISARVTHDHPEGIKGAKAVAAAIFLALHGSDKAEIKDYISSMYYELDFTLDEIRDAYKFDVTCQGSVPQALNAFFESEGYEDAVRNAVSIGGDSDTISCMAGSVAEAFYDVPQDIKKSVLDIIAETELFEIYTRFCKLFGE